MPGANYMGGKRNAMKARTKDTVGRQEKGHFGRQRLNLLSQGINMSKPSERGNQLDLSSSKVRQKIDLAHAREKGRIDGDAERMTTWLIPSPIHIFPSTPRSRKKMRSNNAHTSSSGGKSKVLEALNTTEPSFLKAMKEKILAMPDLACLSKEENPQPAQDKKQIWKPRSQLESLPVTPKRSINNYKSANTNYSSRLTKEYREDSDTGRDFGQKYMAQTIESSHQSDAFLPHLPSSDKLSSKRSPSASSIDDNSVKNNSSRYSRELFSEQSYEGSFSSPWPINQRRSTSQTSEDINGVCSEWAPSPPAYSPVMADKLDASELVYEYHGLPALIEPKPPKWSRSSKNQTTVYGSLFEQEDPWQTIGLILGLPGYRAERNVDLMEVESDQLDEVENASDEEIPFVMEPKSPSEVEDISDEEPIMKDIWKMIAPTYEEISNKVRSSQADSSYSDFEDDEHSFHEAIALEDSPSPGVIQDFSGHVQREVDDRMLIERDSYRVVHANDSEADVPEPQDRIIDQATRRVDEEDSQAEIVEDMDVDAEHTAMTTDVFAVPALKEVDGRFLGPSLFDEFEESD